MTPEERAAVVIQDEYAKHSWGYDPNQHLALVAGVADAIREAVAEEREACAKLAQVAWEEDCGDVRGITNAADAIRKRGEPPGVEAKP